MTTAFLRQTMVAGILVATLASSAAAQPTTRPETASDERSRHLGLWMDDTKPTKASFLEFRGDASLVLSKVGQPQKVLFTYDVDYSHEPIRINMRRADGSGNPLLGIIEFVDLDTMRLAFSSQRRPDQFKKSERTHSFTLRRHPRPAPNPLIGDRDAHVAWWTNGHGAELTFHGDGTLELTQGKKTEAYRYEVDYSRMPAWLDIIKIRNGKEAGRKKCIFRFDSADVIRVRWDNDNRTRPPGFEPTAAEDSFILHRTRQASDADVEAVARELKKVDWEGLERVLPMAIHYREDHVGTWRGVGEGDVTYQFYDNTLVLIEGDERTEMFFQIDYSKTPVHLDLYDKISDPLPRIRCIVEFIGKEKKRMRIAAAEGPRPKAFAIDGKRIATELIRVSTATASHESK